MSEINGNGRIVRTFEEYKNLTEEERAYFHFEQINHTNMQYRNICKKLEELHKQYAAKRVEYIVYGFVAILLTAFAVSVINNVII